MRERLIILLTALLLVAPCASAQVDTASVLKSVGELRAVEDTVEDFLVANDYISKQIVLLDSIGDNKSLADCYYRLAINCSNSMKQAQSLNYIQRSLKYCQMVQDSALLADIYFTLGSTYAESKIYEMALDYFARSYAISDRRNDSAGVVKAQFTTALIQGELYGVRNDTSALLDALAKCEFLFPILKDDPRLIKQYMNFCINVPGMYLDAITFSDEYRSEKFLAKAAEVYQAGEPLNELHPMVPIARFYPKVRLLCCQGRLADARAALLRFSRESEYENYIYYNAACCYYKAAKDYPNYLKFSAELRKMNNRDFSAQCYAEYEQNQSKADFEVEMEKHEAEARERNMLFEQENERAKLQFRYMFWIFGFVLVIIAIIVGQFISSSKINKTLKKTNDDIMFRNQTLERLQAMTLAQTSEIQQQSDLISAQKDDLKKTNDSLMGSLNYASRIQRAAVPSDSMMDEIFPERIVFWRPRNIVSGDFYWATQDGRRKYLITADCTGHGVPGALLSMLGMSIINDVFASVKYESTAADILNLVKDKFTESWAKSGGNIEDGMDLAFFIIDDEKHQLQYAGAKRSMVMVRNCEMTVVKPDKLCVGYNIRKETAKFTNHVIDTKPGDMFYAYSDGIPDQFGGDDGKTKFGQKMLEDLLTNISDLPVPIQQSAVTASVEGWKTCNGQPVSQLDDQLLIGIKI